MNINEVETADLLTEARQLGKTVYGDEWPEKVADHIKSATCTEEVDKGDAPATEIITLSADDLAEWTKIAAEFTEETSDT